jgi:hypothetical protein
MSMFSRHRRAALQPLLDQLIGLPSREQRRHWLTDLRRDCPRVASDLDALLHELDGRSRPVEEHQPLPAHGSPEWLGLHR